MVISIHWNLLLYSPVVLALYFSGCYTRRTTVDFHLHAVNLLVGHPCCAANENCVTPGPWLLFLKTGFTLHRPSPQTDPDQIARGMECDRRGEEQRMRGRGVWLLRSQRVSEGSWRNASGKVIYTFPFLQASKETHISTWAEWLGMQLTDYQRLLLNDRQWRKMLFAPIMV